MPTVAHHNEGDGSTESESEVPEGADLLCQVGIHFRQ